ncbi:serum paraoxonase/arylesterase 2-like [Dendronephthya gigantea]|uniref:serum paraoxonase/arylesterase 2-like n=1 Tax=Dendronephthya gigantea TaxID=151771 RepID=UPI00106CC931|nr:serum paraoxonase/arylesterase 2-like [Dendronephthya gigantea]
MGYIKQALLIGFFAWLLVRVIVLNSKLRMMGFGVPVFNHNPGPCKIIHVNGSEDIDVLPNGLAVISSGYKDLKNPDHFDPKMMQSKGMLYAFDLNKPDEKPTPLSYENFDDSTLIPHGIDLYVDPKTEEISLFVVNHALGKHSIEVFQFDQENMVLKHRKTVVDEKIYSPNDVVAVGPDSFYTTNDRYFEGNVWLGYVEALYPLKLGNVVFHDGTGATFVADRFIFPNGINIDASGRYVFVALSFEAEVVVFKRTDENDLIELQRVHLGLAPDNINFDDNGDLWIGLSNYGVTEFASNYTKPCPGAVLQVKLSKQENDRVPFKVDDIREVFSNSGEGEFKCVSTAVSYREKLLVGNPLSNMMYCEVLVV